MADSSPDHYSSPVEDDSHTPPSAHSQPHGHSLQPTNKMKRRRVTRACDECRRKKIKCDGKQPCTHCTVYSYDCTYDQPSNRKRNPAPQYIEALEHRLQRAEALLRSVLPNVDLNDLDGDVSARQAPPAEIDKAPAQSGAKPPTEAAAELWSMIESTGQLDLDESGHWDFHGGSSGAVFIKRMREQFGGLLGNDQNTPFLPKLPQPYPPSMFEPPRSSADSPFESGFPSTVDLPSRETAKDLCGAALNCACALLRFVHLPSFYTLFDRIYDIKPEDFGNKENQFLPLLYVVLALGSMFSTDLSDGSEQTQSTYRAGIDQGLKYFRAARHMMDITDCRDITSLQAILFMILFLQSSANLSTCYSYIGIALRSSLRMGLHRNLAGNFNPIERETRRRVFWIIRKMDIYVSALLGFPQMLSNDDIDQELPIEVDDEYITRNGVLSMPVGKTSLYAASNAHTRLMAILAKVIRYIYPIKGLEQSVQATSNASYGVSHAKIKEIERDLAEWLDRLPMDLRPGGDAPTEAIRAQQLLRLAYAHVQMMLYRPFLHYVSRKSGAGKTDGRSYACASACVSVSRNIIHITTEMKKRGLLIGAYWFTMYTTFFAIISLVYFVLENPDKAGSQEALIDAYLGKDALQGLAKRSQAADRCSTALKGLFEKLPERLETGPSMINTTKKRSATSQTPSMASINTAPDLPYPREQPVIGLIPRATTFPVQGTIQSMRMPRPSLDGNRFQVDTAPDPSLRHSFHELTSPTDMSAAGTPDSSSTAHSMQQQKYPFLQQFGANNAFPDLSAMMFPSADPFAYPNQPMMELDNIKSENMEMMTFLPNGGAGQAIYDDGLEGQLFGPLPPYLTQGQPNFVMQNQMNESGHTIGGFNVPEMVYHTGMTPNNDMNFDGIFSGDSNEWGNMLADQRYGQCNDYGTTD